MLKKLFALSDQGERELKHGIVATTIGHLCIMAPISLLMLVTMGLLNRLCGETGLTMQPGVIVLMAAVLLLLIFITQWVQYNLTYKVAYEESANRRITLAEKLRRLPLAFFGQRDLSDLTTTMMGDCSKLERIFSNAVPSLFGTVIMFVIVSVGLLIMDWRMGLCIVLPVPVAALILIVARKAQTKAESRNYDAHRAAYDGVQEYLDTIQELRSAGLEQEYLDGVEKKLDYVVKCAFRNELAPGTAVTLAQLTVRFGLVAVLLVGGLLVAQNMLSVNMFILYLLVAGRVYEPFGSCFMLMAELFSAFVSIERTKKMEATVEQTGQPVCKNNGYDIEFKDVSFSYNDELVLNGISFVAKQEQITALVGPSGSGKSTVSRLPGGYYSNIGENGCALSGGERQRISIARAILKDAPVVILDEATASMDAENENLVQQALSVLLQGKTVLVIAHRMRTIANVDKVVVLEQGRVAETGTPEELLNQKGVFYRLAEAQTVHR